MAQLTEVDEDVCRVMGGVIEQYGLDMVKALIASVRDCPTTTLRALKNYCLGMIVLMKDYPIKTLIVY